MPGAWWPDMSNITTPSDCTAQPCRNQRNRRQTRRPRKGNLRPTRRPAAGRPHGTPATTRGKRESRRATATAGKHQRSRPELQHNGPVCVITPTGEAEASSGGIQLARNNRPYADEGSEISIMVDFTDENYW